MVSYEQMSREELASAIQQLEEQINRYKAMNYNLNMSRGKPCKEQLDLSSELSISLSPDDYKDSTGTDCRNYGGLDGIPEMKKLFAEILGTNPSQTIAMGNSSLNLMYDTIARAMLFGVVGSEKPWCKEESVSFLCPAPGYDRHFAVTQKLGIHMIPVSMTATGPDMNQVEDLVSKDASIKGIWCVPVYSNPDGITYSEETCRRLAAMKTAAPDFTIMWDNSYCVHHLISGQEEKVPDILSLCETAGHANRAIEFASTSKVTVAGAGVACIASSKENIAYIKSHLTIQTIGPDKMNQLRHIRYLKDIQGVRAVMGKHAEILRPKFETVLDILERELGGSSVAHWNKPKGGYFISLFVTPGTAGEVVKLCKDCGVEMTPAGATYPYGKDPDDSNIRIAPSFPPIQELAAAIEVLCTSVKLAAARKAFSQK